MAYLGEDIKKLGFGLMRLPKKDGAIDVDEVSGMVDRFLEAGFTYFDTAWAYEGSEEAARKALVERHPRESYQLATKCAAWIDCETADDAKRQLQVSLDRTGAGYFDFYLLHNLGETRTEAFDSFGMWDWVQEQKQAGLVRHVGFSFHSTADELDRLLTAHPEMEFVQLQVNWADWEDPAIQSRACLDVARRHGKPVVVMEPVKGGMLATPPEPVRDIFRAAEPESSYASWALRFAASQSGVLTVLSGMSTPEQMEDNIATMRGFDRLTDSQTRTVGEAQEALASIPLVPCTSCNYCAKVCPRNVAVSAAFSALNLLTLYGNREAAAKKLSSLATRNDRALPDACVKCGACEEACPQHIAIREELDRAVAELL